jgi:D-xylonolactonase
VIGGMTVQADGSLLVFMEAGRIAMLRDGQFADVIAHNPDDQHCRFNDVIAAPDGSVFCGTLSYQEGGTGRLYHLQTDRSLSVVVPALGIANGMGFSPDLSTFYLTDSAPAREIYRFDFERETSKVRERRLFAQSQPDHGFPDGLTVDADGYLWSACWDGGRLIRYTPDGAVDAEIFIPNSKKVSSVTFGGADNADMFVTTAGGDDKAENGENAGSVFHVRIEGIRGRSEFRSRIALF